MANTTNFGWETPDDTDLVKDGAAAMRTLGSAIDTSLVDLKGGTTGQVLAKNSNTDMDFVWSTDATGIPATLFDAKGDLIVASAADTAARLAVGTNGQVLTADSTATNGVKWATASAGATFSGCELYMSANLTVANITLTTVNFDSESFDVDGYHSTSSNTSRITIPSGKTGYFLIKSSVVWDAGNDYYLESWLYKNGSLLCMWGGDDAGIYKNVLSNSKIIYATPTDYFELKVKQQNGGDRDLLGGTDDTTFSITYLGA